jgi:hypothetical protein
MSNLEENDDDLKDRVRQSGDRFHLRTDVRLTDIGLAYALHFIPRAWRKPYRAFSWQSEYRDEKGRRWAVIQAFKDVLLPKG